jgi:AcrR family transcriptional regulator
MPATEPAGLRPPVQARSAASLARVLDAAEALAAEKGFAATTMAEIAQRGRSSVGALYARFRDKDALLDHLHQRFCERALAQIELGYAPERWTGRGVREIVAATVATLLRADATRAGLVRAFVVRGATDEAFTRRAAQVGRAISRRVTELVLARRDEVRCADPEAAVEFGVWLVFAHMDQRALFGPVRTTTRVRGERERARELTRAFLALLGIPDSPAPRRRERRAPAGGSR